MVKNKLVALAASLGLAGLISASASAFTTDANGKVTDTGTLTVTNLASCDDELGYYKVVDVYQSGNIVSFQFTSDFSTWIASNDAPVAYRNMTIEQYQQLTSGSISDGDGNSHMSTDPNVNASASLDGLIAAYVAYKNGSGRTAFGACSDAGGTGPTRSATVAAGAYIIAPISATKVYALMLGNVGVKIENGTYVLDNSSATIKAKVGDPNAVQKTANGTSFDIDEDISFVITVTIPAYPTNAVNKTYTLTDNDPNKVRPVRVDSFTSGNTTYYYDGWHIYDHQGGNELGTAMVDSSGYLTIVLSDVTAFGTSVDIAYTARLQGNANAGTVGNVDTVTLTYPDDPYNSSSSTSTKTASATVYTYGIKVYKTDESNNPLGNVQFQVYDSNDNLMTCYFDYTSGYQTTITTWVNAPGIGEAYCRGLKAGTYTLRETNAPVGYSLAPAQTVVVNSTTAVEAPSQTNYGTDGYTLVSLSNSRSSFVLPFTGGRGVLVYAIAGVGIVSIASVYYYRKKKNQA